MDWSCLWCTRLSAFPSRLFDVFASEQQLRIIDNRVHVLCYLWPNETCIHLAWMMQQKLVIIKTMYLIVCTSIFHTKHQNCEASGAPHHDEGAYSTPSYPSCRGLRTMMKELTALPHTLAAWAPHHDEGAYSTPSYPSCSGLHTMMKELTALPHTLAAGGSTP